MSIVYKCKKCIKEYSTYKSLWRHDALKHKSNISLKCDDDKSNSKSTISQNVDNKYKCSYCIKSYKHFQSRWKHENICKNKIENKNEIEEIKEKNAKMEREMTDYKAEIDKLRDIIQNSLKIHHQTLKKITKDLSNNNVSINGNNNLTNNNNGTINNNITYVQLGNEDLVNVLSKSEKRGILNRRAMGINDLVELIHCSGKYKQFMNVYITNLQNTVAYRYDKKTNNFIVVNKNELLDEIIEARIYDITKFLEEAEKYLEPTMVADIKRIIKKMETDSFKGLKKEEIKFILYNNKDKIMLEKDTTKELEI